MPLISIPLNDARWQGATWTLPAGRAVNTPATVGGELLVDGGLENWTSATNLTDWTETVAGTSSVNRDAINKRTGNFCARLDIDAGGSSAQVRQSFVSPKNWYYVSIYVKKISAYSETQIGITGENYIQFDSPVAYTKYTVTDYVENIEFYFRRSFAPGASIAFDDASAMQLSTATLPRIIPFSTQYFTTLKAGWTVGSGLQAGVIANLDNLAAPNNFVLAIHNGTNAQLWKCVAGVYTNLINVAAAYAADRVIEIRRPSYISTSYQLWYNGVQIGVDQVIPGMTGINNGAFSTGDGSSELDFWIDEYIPPAFPSLARTNLQGAMLPHNNKIK